MDRSREGLATAHADGATPLTDMFTTMPDVTPYKHLSADPRVFKPNDTFDPSDPKFEKRRKEASTIKMDDPRYLDYLYNSGQKIVGGGN